MFKKVVVLTLMLPSMALAGKTDPTWNPPAQYDRPFSGDLSVTKVPVGQVDEACVALYTRHGKAAWRWQVGANQHGCTILSGNRCEVIIPRGNIMRATPAAVLRHELGHCNGWQHD